MGAKDVASFRANDALTAQALENLAFDLQQRFAPPEPEPTVPPQPVVTRPTPTPPPEPVAPNPTRPPPHPPVPPPSGAQPPVPAAAPVVAAPKQLARPDAPVT